MQLDDRCESGRDSTERLCGFPGLAVRHERCSRSVRSVWQPSGVVVVPQCRCDESVGVGLAASEDLGVDAVHHCEAVAGSAGYLWGFDSCLDP